MKNRLNQGNLFIIIVIMIFIKMLILNYLTPLIADDFRYSMSTSIWNAFQSEYNHYMTWGGRSVVHFIARFFLMLPKDIFNFFNALVFILLILLILRIANPIKKMNIPIYLFAFFRFGYIQ